MKIDIGIQENHVKEIVDGLSLFLADTYALYLKTQNFHWNLEGASFISLHLLLQKQYEDMAEAVDEIAERIRSLGCYAEGSFSSFMKKTEIVEENAPLSWEQMITKLGKDHEFMAKKYRSFISQFQSMQDEISADLFIKRLSFHEKQAWLLRGHLLK